MVKWMVALVTKHSNKIVQEIPLQAGFFVSAKPVSSITFVSR